MRRDIDCMITMLLQSHLKQVAVKKLCCSVGWEVKQKVGYQMSQISGIKRMIL